VYFVRVLIDLVHFDASQKRPKIRELRRSLGTKCPVAARRMTFSLNALLEGAATSRREAIVNDFLARSTCGWTLPGISCDDDDDQARLERFLGKFPPLVDALARRIASAPAGATEASAPSHPAGLTMVPAASFEDGTVRRTGGPDVIQTHTASPAPQIVVTRPPALDDGPPHRQRESLPPQRWPKNPKRLSAAREAYLAYYNQSLKTQSDRTSVDIGRLLDAFVEFLNGKHPHLGEDPWVHDLDSSHVSEFLSEQSKRPGKRKDADGNALPAAPLTMLKKLNGLRHFFDHQYRTAKSTSERISDGFEDAAKAWSVQAKREDVHYWPFTDAHIKRIFDPKPFLSNSRDPDYFWCPLLGLYLGVRLGDVVDAKVADIGYIAAIDTWYIEVPVDRAKNDNSVRRLPITRPLIELGFLDYVEHLRKLDAQYLFPNRDWDAATYQFDPSKNQSHRFGLYLDKLDIKHPMLVFHSFRHTLITVMQDAGVPLAHAMQIAGHEAQDHAVRTKRITEEQARSVHLSVYTHADLDRLGTEYPLLALRQHLERSMNPPIDVPRLKTAAAIVMEHVKKVAGKFRSGWPPQRERYTADVTARLDAVTANPDRGCHPISCFTAPGTR
jgi:integrase